MQTELLNINAPFEKDSYTIIKNNKTTNRYDDILQQTHVCNQNDSTIFACDYFSYTIFIAQFVAR